MGSPVQGIRPTQLTCEINSTTNAEITLLCETNSRSTAFVMKWIRGHTAFRWCRRVQFRFRKRTCMEHTSMESAAHESALKSFCESVDTNQSTFQNRLNRHSPQIGWIWQPVRHVSLFLDIQRSISTLLVNCYSPTITQKLGKYAWPLPIVFISCFTSFCCLRRVIAI